MSAKTKIVVLRMKELIYTGIFVALGILLIILLIIMFLPGRGDDQISSQDQGNTAQQSGDTNRQDTSLDNTDPTASGSHTATSATATSGTDAAATDLSAVSSTNAYIPGVYTTELILNGQSIDVEVIVNQSSITSVRLVNLSETVATMYPLLEPTFDSICTQVYEKQTVDGITYQAENKYTSLVLLEAIRSSLEKAQPQTSVLE